MAKIGFDLAARFSASYDPSNRVVTIVLPEPIILSLETVNPEANYYLEEDGHINRLDHARSPADLDSAQGEGPQQRRINPLAVGDAKRMIETRFHDLFRAFDVKVVVLFSANPAATRNEV